MEANPSAIQRTLYQYNLTNPIWQEGDSRPPLGQEKLDRYLVAGQWIWDLYNNTWGTTIEVPYKMIHDGKQMIIRN